MEHSMTRGVSHTSVSRSLADISLPRWPLILLTVLALLLSSIIPGTSSTQNEQNENPHSRSLAANRDFLDDGFWAETSTNKLQTNSTPGSETPVWSAAGNTIRISLARNEYESFQLAFRPATDLSETVTIHQPLGPSKLATGNFSLYSVEYAGSIYPDPLVPMEPDYMGVDDPDTGDPESLSWDIDLASDTTSAIWVTVYAPPDAPAGTYVSNITFTQSSSEVSRRLEIEIWDFVLPENPSLGTWFESSSSSYYSYYPFNYLDAEHVEFMKNVYGKFKSHRITPGKLCTIEPWGNDFSVDAQHDVTVDFTRSDPILEYYMNELNISRFEFPISGYNPIRWDRDEYDFSDPPYTPTPDYTNVIGQYIEQVADHYRDRGWLDRCVFYYCDEPYAYTRSCGSPHSHPPYSLQRDLDDIINANAPDMKHIITKSIEPPLYGTGEIWDAPHTQYHLNDAAIRQVLGEKCWWYNVGGGISNPGMGLRSLYWHSFNQRVDGVEHWGMNYWNYNTVNNDPWQGSGANGNGYMLYPGSTIGMDDDIIISIRLELTRDGLEDYEYLLRYSELFGRDSAEALARVIQPASEFEHDNPMEVSDTLLYGAREYIARAILGQRDDDTSLWLHRLNGTRSGPGPWDDHGSGENYDQEGISASEGLAKTWYGDGGYELAMEEEAFPLYDCDSAGGWFPNNQPSLSSSITVETSPEKHMEGTGALNLSFWRDDTNQSQLYNCRVQRNSFPLSDWSDYDLFEFDCKVEGMSLNNFYVELGFQGGSWYDRIGRYTRTGMLPGRWHHIVIDISQLDRTSFDHIQVFTHNNKLEVPFHRYSLIVDNITLRSANRTSFGNVTFETIDLGPVPAASWQIEVLGDWPLYEECNVNVRTSSSDDGSSWGDWNSIARDTDSIFGYTGFHTPRRYVRIEVGLLGNENDRTVSPCISEVRMWHLPLRYADIGISPGGFLVIPELPTAGADMNLEMELHNAGETEIGPVFVSISADSGGIISSIRNDSVFLVPGKSVLPVEDIALAAGDHVITVVLYLPPGVINTNLLNNSMIVNVHVNAPPVPAISAPLVAESHKKIVFNGSDSLDPDGEITAYLWDMGDGTTLEGPLVNHTYIEQKDYEVRLTVTDDSGFNVSTGQSISIGIPIPTAEILHEPIRGNVTTDYILSAVIFDPLGAVDGYNWLLPGGQERTGKYIEWRFYDDGARNVSLTIEFAYAPYRASTWKHILVDNLPPVAAATASRYEVRPGEEITFSSDGTTDPDDESELLSYRWDFGDGGNSSEANVRRAYAGTGTFMVNLTVTDDDGEFSRSSFPIYVHTDPPVADFEVPDVYVNETARFHGGLASDPDGEVVNYTWELKGRDGEDSVFLYGKYVDHVFDSTGDYTLNLTVRDDGGDVDTLEKDFRVRARDMDGDGIVDEEDPDIDGDGVPNEEDSHPTDPKKGGEDDSSVMFVALIATMGIVLCLVVIALVVRRRRKERMKALGDMDDEPETEAADEMDEEELEKERKRIYDELYGGREKTEQKMTEEGEGEEGVDELEDEAEEVREIAPAERERIKRKQELSRMRSRRRRMRGREKRRMIMWKRRREREEEEEYEVGPDEEHDDWLVEDELEEVEERAEEPEFKEAEAEEWGAGEEKEEKVEEEPEEEYDDWIEEEEFYDDEEVEYDEWVEEETPDTEYEDWDVGVEEWTEGELIEKWEEVEMEQERPRRRVEFVLDDDEGAATSDGRGATVDEEEIEDWGVEFEIVEEDKEAEAGQRAVEDWGRMEFELIEEDTDSDSQDGEVEEQEMDFEIIGDDFIPEKGLVEVEDWGEVEKLEEGEIKFEIFENDG